MILSILLSLIVELFDSKLKLTNVPLDLDDVCATLGESAESSGDLIGRNCALIIGSHVMTIPIIEMNTHFATSIFTLFEGYLW